MEDSEKILGIDLTNALGYRDSLTRDIAGLNRHCGAELWMP